MQVRWDLTAIEAAMITNPCHITLIDQIHNLYNGDKNNANTSFNFAN